MREANRRRANNTLGTRRDIVRKISVEILARLDGDAREIRDILAAFFSYTYKQGGSDSTSTRRRVPVPTFLRLSRDFTRISWTRTRCRLAIRPKSCEKGLRWNLSAYRRTTTRRTSPTVCAGEGASRVRLARAGAPRDFGSILNDAPPQSPPLFEDRLWTRARSRYLYHACALSSSSVSSFRTTPGTAPAVCTAAQHLRRTVQRSLVRQCVYGAHRAQATPSQVSVEKRRGRARLAAQAVSCY